MRADAHQTDLLAKYRERLDEAAGRIARLQDSGTITAAEADRLSQREIALRYQVRQLHSATANARSDLESGLELAWPELRRALDQHAK